MVVDHNVLLIFMSPLSLSLAPSVVCIADKSYVCVVCGLLACRYWKAVLIRLTVSGRVILCCMYLCLVLYVSAASFLCHVCGVAWLRLLLRWQWALSVLF